MEKEMRTVFTSTRLTTKTNYIFLYKIQKTMSFS